MVDVEVGIAPIRAIRSSVPAIVGIAPHKAKDTLFLVSNPTQAAEFGLQVPGFTIPQALAAIFANQPTPCLVVNVFDPVAHTVAVLTEDVTIVNGKARLAFPNIGAFTAFLEDDGITATGAVLNTDYTVNDFGDIEVLDAVTLPDGDYVISYKKLDITAVTNANIVGSVIANVRTGLKVFQLAYNKYRIKPKQIIAPGFTDEVAVCNALKAESDYYNAITWIDAEEGTAPDEAIENKNDGTLSSNFFVAHRRVNLLYNRVKAFDDYSQADRLDPAAAYAVGLTAAVDYAEGYHVSPSNHEVKGITGVERDITWDINDPDGLTEANMLNEQGIITIIQSSVNKLWGNRSSLFPSSTSPYGFIPVLRTRDVVADSVAYYMEPFLDKPIGLPQIDSITESVNAFIRELQGRGALLEGSECIFDPTLNSVAQLALGHIVFTITFMVPTPMERITFNLALDVNLLKKLLQAA